MVEGKRFLLPLQEASSPEIEAHAADVGSTAVGRPTQMVIGAIFMDLHNRVVGQVDAFRGGDPAPSEVDVEWAGRMRKACNVVHLELLDYLVLAGERCQSIRRMKNW